MKEKKVLYIDMDEVLADFMAHPLVEDHTRHPTAMYEPGFFLNLEPVPGALVAVRKLHHSGLYDIHVLTQPLAESPVSYMEKAQWIWKWFPELGLKLNMTQDKGLFRGDYLIDDNAEKWKERFESTGGKFIHFRNWEDPKKMWDEIIEELIND